ncbi:sugar phosphate isomerase/epimerase family protein (plasmid) [Roseobacteraceae bacterium NS-SX3]
MILAASNIAWPAEADASIAPLLLEAGAGALEAAPARLHGDPAAASAEEAEAIRAAWDRRGLPVISMQALLFGKPELCLFGPDETVQGFTSYLARIIAFAGRLGAGPLVFGSPGNRRRGGLDTDEACARAVPVFRALGDTARAHGTVFCLEPNALGYGCDFMTTLDEAAAVVRAAGHDHVGLVADTGNMAMAGDPPEAAARHAGLVRHLHLSRPQLAPLDEGDDFPRRVLDALRAGGYAGAATVEMRQVPQDPIGAVARALHIAREWIG